MDALLKIPSRKYDLVLALAILEHFSKEEGISFLNELRRIGRRIILSVPKEWHDQVVPENEFETHRSHWTDTELLSWGFRRLLPHPSVWIAVFDGEGGEEVRGEEMYLFSKQPEFHNNVQRFLFKLFRISPNETKSADLTGKLEDDSPKTLCTRYATSEYEKWALRYRLGSKILAVAMVEVKGETLFIHDIMSKETYLEQMLQKLENLAIRRGLKLVEIIPGIHQHELEALGYKPFLYSISHTHSI